VSETLETKRNLVVIHYKDGKLLRGYTLDFTPIAGVFHLTSELEEDKGKVYDVVVAELKAVFFVKTLYGSTEYKEKKKFEEVDTSRHRGLKIKIVFKDGETIRGMSLGYSKGRKGFFLIPVDPKSNNERIWVVMDAIKEIQIGSAAIP
jgi:hypothetical protein